MIEVNFSHSKINDLTNLQEKFSKISSLKQPVFFTHKTNLAKIKTIAKRYSKYKNLIVIGRGGSISSFEAIYRSLKEFDSNKKNVFIVKTLDPDFIAFVKKKCSKKNSLVLLISKSGTNIEVNENLFQFQGFKTIVITTFHENPLHLIAQKLGLELFEHPEIGGRFTGGTEVALFPAALAGVKIEKILEGVKESYSKFNYNVPIEQNNALKLAAILFKLELQGFTEVFIPIYSSRLSAFNELITQLMHESVCKQGQGQTILCAEAPESQHHTNQRFFGGKKNICGVFLRAKNFSSKEMVIVPKNLWEVKHSNESIKVSNNLDSGKLMEFEFNGTFEEAIKNNIPVLSISLDKVDEKNIGELIGFLQFLAVYSALLREVNPFDQPHVEGSKKISFEYRKKFAQKNS